MAALRMNGRTVWLATPSEIAPGMVAGHIEEFADAAFGHRQNGLVQVARRFEAHAVTSLFVAIIAFKR